MWWKYGVDKKINRLIYFLLISKKTSTVFNLAINLSDQFQKLGQDKELLFMGLEIINKSSSISAVKKKSYTYTNLMKDLNLFMPQKFPSIKEKKIQKYYERLKKILKTENDKNLLLLFYDDKNVKDYCDVNHEHILNEIESQIRELEPTEKVAVYIFLKNYKDFEGMNREHFRMKFRELVNSKYPRCIPETIDKDISSMLIKSGLLFESYYEYSDPTKQSSGLIYSIPIYIKTVDQFFLSELRKDTDVARLIESMRD